MNIILRLSAVCVGWLLNILIINAMVKRKLSESQSILWLFASWVIIILGIFPSVISWTASVMGVWWPPAVFIALFCIVLYFIAFSHTKLITALRSEVTELAIQVTLLKEENEKLKSEKTVEK